MGSWSSRENEVPELFGVTGDRREDGTLRIRVEGELDTFRVAELRECFAVLLTETPRCVELDLSAVGFCDVAGLRELFRLRHRGHAEGFDVVLVAVSPPVRLLLELSGDEWPDV
jgi:anti-anti-sigma factor